MKATLFVVLGLAVCSGCATTLELPQPDGAQFAPGMYSFATQRDSVLSSETLDAWEPNQLYPALSNVAPKLTAARPEVLPTRVPRHATARGPASASAWLWYSLYKETLSRVDGNTCRFHPSCSTFGLQAVRDYGLLGIPMTFGRLHKNHGDQRHYPMPRPPLLEDPIDNYGFWLQRPALDDFASYDNEAFGWYQHLRAVKRLRASTPP